LVSLFETVELASAASLIPLFLGVYVGHAVRGRPANTSLPVVTTVAAGIMIWFFLDVMGEAALLGLNQGLAGGPLHLLIVLLFPIGFFTMILLEKTSQSHGPLDLVYLAAVAIGFHGLAEGITIGSGLSLAPDPIAAIGGVLAVVSFVVHKALEGFVVSVFLNPKTVLVKTVVAVLAAGLPTVFGSMIGLGFSPDSSYFFALSGGSALWLLGFLIQKSTSLANRTLWAIALLAGILLMYSAGLLHSA